MLATSSCAKFCATTSFMSSAGSATSSGASSPVHLCEEIELKCLFGDCGLLPASVLRPASTTCPRAGPTIRKFWLEPAPAPAARLSLRCESAAQPVEVATESEPECDDALLVELSRDRMEPDEWHQRKRRRRSRSWRRLFGLDWAPLLPSLASEPPACTIMISYQHAEAQKYARKLKRALAELGLGAYLDVDEIASGADWQDALNSAVLQCSALVALVTPSYGATTWTARELKLADLVGKRVLPVNFGQPWPPRPLAIQFASLQFVPAWTRAPARPFAPDRRGPKWDSAEAARVAAQLARALGRHAPAAPEKRPADLGGRAVELLSRLHLQTSGNRKRAQQ